MLKRKPTPDEAALLARAAKESELKPCPFCGGKAVIGGGGCRDYFVYCADCIATTRPAFTEAEAIAAWNTRADGYCAFAQPTDLTDGCALLQERTCRNTGNWTNHWECSECGKIYEWTTPNYCPNCGARVVQESVQEVE